MTVKASDKNVSFLLKLSFRILYEKHIKQFCYFCDLINISKIQKIPYTPHAQEELVRAE